MSPKGEAMKNHEEQELLNKIYQIGEIIGENKEISVDIIHNKTNPIVALSKLEGNNAKIDQIITSCHYRNWTNLSPDDFGKLHRDGFVESFNSR